MSFDDEDENKPNETRTGKEVSTVKHSNAPTTASDNPFADYADAAMSNTLNGTLLIFAKGDYLAGKEKRPVAIGTRMVVNMDSFSIGPVRWSGGKPVESFMGRVVDRFVPPPRRALGHNDESLWDKDKDGDPKDPIQYTVKIELANPETREVFTFPTSSLGGRGALDKLCKAYADARAKHLAEWPVIELGVGSYPHPNKDYGRVKYPAFNIVGWVAKDAASTEPAPAPQRPRQPALVDNPLGDDGVPFPNGPDDYDFDDNDR
jgi:hypothetical protein